jgi:hypothetical protein
MISHQWQERRQRPMLLKCLSIFNSTGMEQLKKIYQKYKPEIRVGIAVFAGLFAFKIVKDLLDRLWPD